MDESRSSDLRPGDGPPGETVAWPGPAPPPVGTIIDDRYRLDRPLGRGGMGEVWLASDLKLGLEIALKFIRVDSPGGPSPEALRREVRAARGVSSAHVCRIFDLVDVAGRECISMEYVDGITLREHMRRSGPVAPPEAARIAGQLLAGLHAVHAAGLVHRDIKPENVMLTPAGRVVVMDLGIARALAATGHGTVAGTPAYMAPEQARGEPLDVRADIYAAGLLLAELTTGSLSDPGTLMETAPEPWRALLQRALAPLPDGRFPSAQAMARAVEEATLGARGEDDRCPYPGLAPFREADAEYFHGREADVEALLRRLKRLHLLGLVGPSGAGKTSFLRAGLLSRLPDGWGAIYCAPGPAPFVALGQALGPRLAGDAEALRDIVRFAEPDVAVALLARWRRRQVEAVLVVDQFEELFTQNQPEAQAGFANLLGRLPVEAGVKVLLSLRDDFLVRCAAQPGLRPILNELTVLSPLGADDLRRAVAEPARTCGYQFEDASLVDRMVADLEGERGALPLLAFCAARLWERRDRARGLLTTAAYEQIGGVAGALAQHAEATLERVGAPRQGVVRELFRNLVTAQDTRAARERDELLSVFPDRGEAADVLDRLIDARLLTAYDVPDPADARVSRQRVEIVHESLLTRWPRLVRWRTQDADSAQMRDQLRQIARLWEEKGRPEDLLWTGTVHREFQLWRERYPGGLSSQEQAFVAAMTGRARRRRRRRRLALTSAFGVLVAVLAVFGLLWRRSALAERRAVAEQRHAEASLLVSLGEQRLAQDPTLALAHAIAALELEDRPDARRFACEVLATGPLRFELPTTGGSRNPSTVAVSPDGRWCAVGWTRDARVTLYPCDGGEIRQLPADARHGAIVYTLGFDAASSLLYSASLDSTVRLWSLPDGTAKGTAHPCIYPSPFGLTTGNDLIVGSQEPSRRPRWEAWPLPAGPRRSLGETAGLTETAEEYGYGADPLGRWLYCLEGPELWRYPLPDLAGPGRLLVGRHEGKGMALATDALGRRLATMDDRGELLIWDSTLTQPRLMRRHQLPAQLYQPVLHPNGSMVAAVAQDEKVRVWDLDGFAGEAPLELAGQSHWVMSAAFHPVRPILVSTANGAGVALWPLHGRWPNRLEGEAYARGVFAFDAEGRFLAVTGAGGTTWCLPLDAPASAAPRLLHSDPVGNPVVHGFDPEGRYILTYQWGTGDLQTLVPTGGGPALLVPAKDRFSNVALTGQGRVVSWRDSTVAIQVWEPATGRIRRLPWASCLAGAVTAATADGDLLAYRDGHLVRLDLEDGTVHAVQEDLPPLIKLSPGGRFAFGYDAPRGEVFFYDLTQRRRQPLFEAPGLAAGAVGQMFDLEFDSVGKFVLTRDPDETIAWLRPLDGSAPHLLPGRWPLMGHAFFRIDPRGRWIAATAPDGNGVWLWPGPAAESLYARPLPDFLAHLRAMTNVRVSRSPSSAQEYSPFFEQFSDWRQVPVDVTF